MPRGYKSKALAALHETVSDMFEAGVIDKRTMRDFDASCLTPIEPFSAEDIRALREREKASQAVFARHLNVAVGVLSKWERGEKHPRGASLKILALVKKNGLAAIS